ncbi:MAG TPA: hypothetical protein PLL66_07420 [Bacteroidales bacterium]|nr:hypothetical protein [Bacteroidales bacterium]
MEAKPNMIKKYNKPIIGLALGLVLPIISFMIYFIFLMAKNPELKFMEFIEKLLATEAFTPVFSLCVLPNLILFFIFKKLDYWYSIKGLIFSVLIYTLLVLVLKFV